MHSDYEILKNRIKLIEDAIKMSIENNLQNTPNLFETNLGDAIMYAISLHDHRISSFLLLESASLFGVEEDKAVKVAMVLEILHTCRKLTGALISDDLSNYQHYKIGHFFRKYDTTTAILVTLGLLHHCYSILVDPDLHHFAAIRIDLVNRFAKSAGILGLIAGQMMTIEYKAKELHLDQIARLQRMKIGSLFALSCELGASLGEAPPLLINNLSCFGNNIGIAFQINHDLLKKNYMNYQVPNTNLISKIGEEEAKAHANMLAMQAKEYLSLFDIRATNHLKLFVDYLISIDDKGTEMQSLFTAE